MSVVKRSDMELSVDGLSVVTLCDVEEYSVVKLSAVLLVVEVSVEEVCDARSDVLPVSVVKPSDMEVSVDGLSVVTLWVVEESSVAEESSLVQLSMVLWLPVWAWMVVLVCVV